MNNQREHRSRLALGAVGPLESYSRAQARELDGLRSDLAEFTACAQQIRSLVSALRARMPYAADTTVHEAWARHPGVRKIFARYHLPACDDCPVGADETLAEAADGYQISLLVLLEQLNALCPTD